MTSPSAPLLSYQILTSPNPLPVATAKVPSTGIVHLIVFNPHEQAVDWSSIQVVVPQGTGSQDLTGDAAAITPGLYADDESRFQRVDSSNVFRALPPVGKTTSRLLRGASLVLILDNVKVNEKPGLPLLGIVETAEGGSPKQPQKSRPTCVGVLKLAADKVPPPPPPNVPRNFRAKYPLVNYHTDTGNPESPLILEWDGPDDLSYSIRIPGFEKDVSIQPGYRQWAPDENDPTYHPKRATTYTLLAGYKDKPPLYQLTTTVQVRRPTLDDGVYTPWLQRRPNEPYISLEKEQIRLVHQGGMAKVSLGTLTAGSVGATTVTCESVKTSKVDAGTGGSSIALTNGNVEIRQGALLGALAVNQVTTDSIRTRDVTAPDGTTRMLLTSEETHVISGKSGWVRLDEKVTSTVVYGGYLMMGTGGVIQYEGDEKFHFKKGDSGNYACLKSGGCDTH